MKKLLSILVLVVMVSLTACEDETTTNTCNPGTLATIKDLTGLDGCGFVFELADGSRLEPQMWGYCGTPPLPKEVTENPLYNFQFVDGKKVRIGYEEVKDAASICMVGKIVKITCIEEVTVTE
jgi:hypothetical protein